MEIEGHDRLYTFVWRQKDGSIANTSITAKTVSSAALIWDLNYESKAGAPLHLTIYGGGWYDSQGNHHD